MPTETPARRFKNAIYEPGSAPGSVRMRPPSHFFALAMGVVLTPPRGRVECAFSAANKLCNEADCKFYPAAPAARPAPRLAVLG